MTTDVEFVFRITLTQKEFSMVTRSLAGHQLRAEEIPVARELNRRMLEMRLVQLRNYTNQAQRALQVAESEAKKEVQQDE